MKAIVFSFLLIGLFISCNAQKNTGGTNEDKNEENAKPNDYRLLGEKESIAKFVGEKIIIDGELGKMPYQHMMKMSPPPGMGEPEEHDYFDPLEKYGIGQLVVYYHPQKVKWPRNSKKIIRVHGTVRSMSGAGKGGGEHTEYYIDADKVEEL